MKRQSGPFGRHCACAAFRPARLRLPAAPALAQRRRRTGPHRLVALGDSLTRRLHAAAGSRLPGRAGEGAAGQGYKVEVANAGVSGDTASAGLDRLDWSVPDGTDGVIVELGANDMLRGLDPAVTRRPSRASWPA